ncbi:COBRA-like protein [Actinidia chinensis var. chinensis]|uniref:COBRA-like protein n=1 Tax=Actinidia chinensis var. chinensis TaxID=1590841 RepID=A0A2R6PU88_ACTCC|nr:COBRA-like protein [Actinidia chinensis var. chinensis]
MRAFPRMKIPWKVVPVLVLILFCHVATSQDYGDDAPAVAAPPPEQDACNGIFVVYTFLSRAKAYPLVKNASAQAWAFKSQLFILNAGVDELKTWTVHIGFQHEEILVGLNGATAVDVEDLPAKVGKNGTTIAGFPMTDLKTAIETAGDYNQIQATVDITGTQFGLKKGTPMPKSIKLVNDGYKCPQPTKHTNTMHICCHKDPRFKKKEVKTKFMPRQYGDLSLTYDVLQAFEGNYLAQVTIDNLNPLGRLDHWNLTWEWMRGEFIYTMRGAYTHKKDSSECIYGPQGQYYQSFDFTPVMNCQRKPVISDLPPEKENDDKVGKLPNCCRNGTVLPTLMNETWARSSFQLQARAELYSSSQAIYPPQRWKINGVINPDYKCGPPVRIDSTEFPDPSGLAATSSAVATWQVTCNITRPKPKQARCCVSFSAYYAEAAVPCSTCACGCEESTTCDPDANALHLPPEALLMPFDNRTEKTKAWAAIKHQTLPKKLPCPDNCGVSINWHVDTDYKSGWTARITLFNWDPYPFQDWFTAIQMKKAFPGYENVYSFNGTTLPHLNDTIFFTGLKGLNYLVGEVNGTNPDKDPRVPGKQQSVISFLKKHTPGINVAQGDGFPSKVIFNGEECALPTELPKRNGASRVCASSIFLSVLTFILVMN